MYQTIFVDKRVELTPKELSDARTSEQIRDFLIVRLKDQEEGKCNAEGYIKPGSIQLLRRSMGVAENGKFTANWVYDCKIRCEILKPVSYDSRDPDDAASTLPVRVIEMNKAGVMAVFEEAIRVLLPRDTHVGIPEFEALKVNDVVRVHMMRHRFQTNDSFISAVGELVTATSVPESKSAEESEEEEEEGEEEETETSSA
jgi:hypothetical protein